MAARANKFATGAMCAGHQRDDFLSKRTVFGNSECQMNSFVSNIDAVDPESGWRIAGGHHLAGDVARVARGRVARVRGVH